MDFAELVRAAREARWRSARQFYTEADLPCTYTYYNSIERGTVPSVEVAIAVIAALGIDQRRGLLAWARSQMPTASTRAVFTDIEATPVRQMDDVPISQATVVNRAQAAFLQQMPVAMEVLIFVNCFDDSGPVTSSAMANHFKMDEQALQHVLMKLYELGLLNKNEDGAYSAKEWVFVPFERDYEPLKDATFQRAYQQFLRQEESVRIRNAVTILATTEQQEEIEARIRSLIDWFVALESKDRRPGAVPYTFGLFASPRRFGDAGH